jgi:hypothetical protein
MIGGFDQENDTKTVLFCSQDVSDNSGAASSNILRHTDRRPLNLIRPPLSTQLTDDLNDLVHTGCSNRMTARFQSTESRDWQATSDLDVTFQAEARTLTPVCKSTGFQ